MTIFERLAPKHSQTRVAILDDKPHQVQRVVEHLESRDYLVEVFTNDSDFLGAIDERVFPIQLIDISLSSGDFEGFTVATKAAEIDPNALRVCISTELGNVSARLVMDSLNPSMSQSTRTPLSIADALGVRDFWAIYDKDTEANTVYKLIENYRLMMGCGDDVVVECDRALLTDFESDFESISWDDATMRREPQVQFIEIVRQLAVRPGQPRVRRVRLQKIGKGRSKTIVAHMSIQCEATSGGSSKNLFPPEGQRIIKIGRLRSIEREVSNYANHVPKLINHIFYPTIEAVGCSRSLAGVAYNRISDSTGQDVAPTLLESLYGQSGGITKAEANNALKQAFGFRVDLEIRQDEQGRSMLDAYAARFGALRRRSNSGEDTYDLDPILCEANRHLLELGIVKEANGVRYFACHKNSEVNNEVASSITELVRDYANYESFYASLCHGDLHLDNILLVRQGKQTQPVNVYIDFADADFHHAAMDYVVMEVAIRFQSLRFLLDSVGKKSTRGLTNVLLHHLATFESALLRGRKTWPSRAYKTDDLPPAAADWLLRTTRFILEIRRQSRIFLEKDLPDSVTRYVARRKMTQDSPGAGVNTEQEQHRYFCGLGLASLSAMDLRQPKEVVTLNKCWFALVGQLLMRTYNDWNQRTNPV